MNGAALLAAAATGCFLWLVVPAARSPLPPRSGSRPLGLRLLAVCMALVVMPRDLAVPCLVLTCAAWASGALWRRRAATRLEEANAAQMAEVCDLLAAELSAGRPAEAALAEAAQAWAPLLPVAEVCRLGGDVPAAFREVAATSGAGGLRLLAAAWSVSLRTGGGLGAATARVADAVRRDQVTRRLVAGELASARATARLVAGLPVLALLLGSGAGADPWSFLLRTPWGWACLGSGLATGLLGLWWMELIASEAEP